MPVTPITSLGEFKALINSGKVIIIDFWAPWCGPCRTISPVLERLSAANSNSNIEFYKVDVDEVTDVSQEAGIRAMPTFQVFKDGAKLDELVGANPAALMNLIQRSSSFA